MTRASLPLIALLFALPSCNSVSLGGSGEDGGGGSDGGMTLAGCDTQPKPPATCSFGEPTYSCVNGTWTAQCPSAPVGGQGGTAGTGGIGGAGGTSGTGTCQARTFDVDCYGGAATYTCVQRGGEWVWDHRCPDLPDAGVVQPVDAASGCDPAKAALAVSAAGLTIVGEAQTMNQTLPSNLSSSANWGVKEAECRAGGYDLSAAAGKTVCLVSFATTTVCQQQPTDAWVVMSDGIVRCIYQAVRPGSPMSPGVYAVRDSSCTSPDAGTASCPGPNPASRTCRNTASECIPSSCTCGSSDSSNSWRCTADCRALPLCAADAGTACSGALIDNKQAASAFAEYMRITNPQVAPRGSYGAEEKTVANLWDTLQAQLFFATWYDDDGTAGNTTAILYRHCTVTTASPNAGFMRIDSGVVANGAFYYSWGSGSGIYRSNLGKLAPSGADLVRSISPSYFNPNSGPPGLVVSLENGRLVVDRAAVDGGKFNEWSKAERMGFLKDYGDKLAVVDGSGKEIPTTLP